MVKEEVWKPITIDGGVFSAWYQVSDFGRVRSCRPKNGKGDRPSKDYRILRPGINLPGYLFVNLCVNGRKRLISIHQLVANEFIGPSNGRDVNHKDSDRKNNTLGNLEYLTRKENLLHAINNGRFKTGSRHYKSKIDLRTVFEIREKFKSGLSVKEIAGLVGVPYATVYDVAHEKTWKHTNKEKHRNGTS